MIIESSVGTKVLAGQLSIGGTRVQLGTGSLKSKFGFDLKADGGNGNTIYIGGPDVSTTNGYPLAAGASLHMDIEDLYSVYAIAGASAQKLLYNGVG